MQGQVKWWLKPQDADGILGILARLDAYGVRTIRESTGEFEQWGTDVETAGTYWATTPEDMVGSWAPSEMPGVAFKLWRGPDETTMVSLTQDRRRCEFSFELDGFWFDEAEQLAAVLFWNAVTTENSIAMIADRLFDFLPEWPLFLENPALLKTSDPDLIWIKGGEGWPPFLHARAGHWR